VPFLETNGVRLHYITYSHGPDIVMLHGFLGNLAVWHLQIVPVIRKQYRITTYDLRGHGYSQVTPSGYSARNMAEDLLGLLDGLGIERPVLVGHSYGADICLYFALRYPRRVSKLVCCEPGLAALVHQRKHESWDGWRYWVDKLQEAGFSVPEDKKNDLEYLLQVSLETPKFYGPARGLPRNRGPLLRLIRETTLVADYEDIGELTLAALPSIQTETLLVYGEESHFLGSFRYLCDVLPNSRPVLLPGGEHFGPLEQPELLVQHIREFVSAEDVPQTPEVLGYSEAAAGGTGL